MNGALKEGAWRECLVDGMMLGDLRKDIQEIYNLGDDITERLVIKFHVPDKKEGSKAFFPINPSNLLLLEINIDDKKRKKIIERKRKKNG